MKVATYVSSRIRRTIDGSVGHHPSVVSAQFFCVFILDSFPANEEKNTIKLLQKGLRHTLNLREKHLSDAQWLNTKSLYQSILILAFAISDYKSRLFSLCLCKLSLLGSLMWIISWHKLTTHRHQSSLISHQGTNFLVLQPCPRFKTTFSFFTQWFQF